MSKYLNPDVVAHDVANAFCKHYVSSLDIKKIDYTQEYREAALIYASAYDEAYNYIIEENRIVTDGKIPDPS